MVSAKHREERVKMARTSSGVRMRPLIEDRNGRDCKRQDERYEPNTVSERALLWIGKAPFNCVSDRIDQYSRQRNH